MTNTTLHMATQPLTSTIPGKVQISVIICAYTDKRWDDLIIAVQSVQRQTYAPVELIVVIDHNPELLERAHRQFRGVLIIENTEARGISGARNCGISTAQGDIIAFMDEDAEASPNWLERLTTHYANEHVMGVGGSISPLWQTGKPAWFPDEFELGGGLLLYRHARTSCDSSKSDRLQYEPSAKSFSDGWQV